MSKLKTLFYILILSLAFSQFAHASDETIKLKDLISACKDIADSTSSKWVNPKISGQKIKINGKLFEVRYFSFEDTSKLLPSGMTFKEYAKAKNLMDKDSFNSTPLPGINFHSFDFRSANLDDKVYFSMAIRAVDN
jgi:hypothetical protein